MAYAAIKRGAYEHDGVQYPERWECATCGESATNPLHIPHTQERCKWGTEEDEFWSEYYAFGEPDYPDDDPRWEEWCADWDKHLDAIHKKYQTHKWMPSMMGKSNSLGGE